MSGCPEAKRFRTDSNPNQLTGGRGLLLTASGLRPKLRFRAESLGETQKVAYSQVDKGASPLVVTESIYRRPIGLGSKRSIHPEIALRFSREAFKLTLVCCVM